MNQTEQNKIVTFTETQIIVHMKTIEFGIVLFLLLLLYGFGYGQDLVPFESKENFGFELDYQFKTRPPPNMDKLDFTKTSAPRGSQTLPYLMIKFDWAELNKNYYRYKVDNSQGQIVRNKKLKFPDSYVLDMGFSDDLKDRVTPHKYSIYFYNKDKERVSRIVIEVAENGDLLLNGEFHGRI